MGVKGLWQLLEPVGRPVTLESMEGKTLAVDVSIWLHQTVHGMRDRHGEPVPNAHLIGIFNRVCKLLFYRIKPIFVFDGGVPALKKQTLAGRRQRRTEATDRSEQTTRKMLDKLLKQQAVQAVLSQGGRPGPVVAGPSVRPVVNNKQPDMYHLPPLPEVDRDSFADEMEQAFEERAAYRNILHEEFQNMDDVDPEAEEFKALPAEIQHELLSELKEVRKHTDWTRAADMPTNSEDFSSFQVTRLMKQSRLSNRLKEVRDEINNQASGDIATSLIGGTSGQVIESRRVVSEDSSHYILIKGLNKDSQRSIFAAAMGETKDEKDDEQLQIQPLPQQAKIVSNERAITSTRLSSETEAGIPQEKFQNDLEFNDILNEQKMIVAVSNFGESPATTTLRRTEAGSSEDVIVIDDSDQDSQINTQPHVIDSDSSEGIHRQSAVRTARSDADVNQIETGLEPQSEDPQDKELYGLEGGFIREDNSDEESEKNTTESIHQETNHPHQISPDHSEYKDKHINKSCSKNPNSRDVSDSLPQTNRQEQKCHEGPKINEGSFILNKTRECAQIIGIPSDRGTALSTGSEDNDIVPRSCHTKPVNEAKAMNASNLKQIDSDSVSLVHAESHGSQKKDFTNLDQEMCKKTSLPDDETTKASTRNNQKRKRLVSEEDTASKVIIVDDEDVSETRPALDRSPAESDEDEGFIEITIDPKKAGPDDDLFPASIFTAEPTIRGEDETIPGVPTPSTADLSVSPNQLEWQPPNTSNSGKTPPHHQHKAPGEKSTPAMSRMELLELQQQLADENRQLQQDRGREERLAASITDQMTQEAQELLQLFGVPFITSPMEAEAQCAHLDLTNQTHGTVTDDSDIWLFGGQRVYKNMFNQSKHVECFQWASIQSQLLLDRAKMINISLLCGSDYTEGIEGIGPVTAMEVLGEFDGEGIKVLQNFKTWWDLAQKRPAAVSETKVKGKLRTVCVPEGFPNLTVVDAYLHPEVDDSEESFTWARPDLGLLRDFAKQKFGWSQSKVDDVLLPVMKQQNELSTQRHITSYFPVDFGEPRRLKSKRVKQIINRMRNGAGTPSAEDTASPSSPVKQTLSQDKPNMVTDKPSVRKGQRSRGCRGQTSTPAALGTSRKQSEAVKSSASGTSRKQSEAVNSSASGTSRKQSEAVKSSASGTSRKQSEAVKSSASGTSRKQSEAVKSMPCVSGQRGRRVRGRRGKGSKGASVRDTVERTVLDDAGLSETSSEDD